MTKKEELIWRLRKLPNASEVAKLVELKVLTADEGRDILLQTQEEKDVETETKSLKDQIKFQQELIEKLLNQLAQANANRNWTFVYDYTPRYPTRYWLGVENGNYVFNADNSGISGNLNVSDNKVLCNVSSANENLKIT